MSIPRLSSETLLLSQRVHDITYDPFCLFQVNDYLPQDAYEALLGSFPNEEWFVKKEPEGDKRYFSTSRTPELFEDFCRRQPIWRELFDLFSSQVLLSDLNALVRQGLFQSRGQPGLRPWRDAATVNLGLRAIVRQPVTPVKVIFEFSRLERGSNVPPHTDDVRKLLSLLLYFPDPKWKDSYEGGTDFYRPKNPAMENNWHNRKVAFEDLIPFTTVPFVPNRLVGLLKSKNSYHGVRPIPCPEGMVRNSLNITVICSVPPQLRLVDKIITRVGSKAEWLKCRLRQQRAVRDSRR